MENQRVRLTKKLLNDSLLYWMQQKPIEHITVKEICEHAELNRSTFYLHYSDQYELLQSLENEVIKETFSCFSHLDTGSSPREFIVVFLNYIHDNQTLFRTMLCQPNRESFRKRFINEALNFLKDGIGVKASGEKEYFILIYLTRGSLAMIQEWILSDFAMSVTEFSELIYNLSDNAIKGKF